MTILDTLRREHANAIQLLRALEWQLAEFKVAKQPDYDVLCAAVDYFLTFPGLSHHPTEDLIFDVLRERAPEIANVVGDLRGAHDALADQVRVLAESLRSILVEGELPRDMVLRSFSEFIQQQRQHIETEERTFFPAAEKMLSKGDWHAVQTNIASAIDPLFDAQADEKFAQLRRAIFGWQHQDELLP
jgi:hemerythrin-like domain-containing protein